jgi:malonyl CoA-acyl carrier protein transacylase
MIPTLPQHSRFRLDGHREENLSPRVDPRWDSEVFVLHGDNRTDLLRRAKALADFLTANPETEPKDLAFTLNTSSASKGSCVAIVAESVAELQSRLARTAERLADPRCRQIKDSRGVYYFDEPLYPRGKIALLFPGEGSQYLNMLSDLLPNFPEVSEHFARCDLLSMQAGGREQPISRHIFVSQSLSESERAAAERDLWRLGNAVSSILISEWALFLLLQQLGLPFDVVGGHSAGEFSALLASGCVEPDDFFIEQLFALAQVLQAQEDDGSLAEMTLLAVASGRRAVTEILDGGGIFVAMDNCPHQTVVACTTEVATAAQQRLRERGIVCERLPFRRPYHTPLFEPFLQPISAMYRRLSIRSPQIPLYSCTTGRLFPTDSEAIRNLAVAHWAAPVEFIRLIETMYADGVRLFVECGPRGNLTSFLQDILRGRPSEAVAVNLPQRSGLTQLNHMVALLSAHHVPLRLDHLYKRRDPRRIEWEASACHNLAVRQSNHEFDIPRSSRTTIVQQYLSTMEQFLDLQSETMERFFARRRGAPLQRRPAWPLLGNILRHDPGREIVLRRLMDVNEDLYAGDHTLGGRDASSIDPTQHGLPFMPMAFSLEMMAEAASLLLPGRNVVGMKRVRLQRWIPFDDEPITLELTARVRPESPNEVAIEIRDFGNPIRPSNADTPAVVGTVVMDTRYPETPPPEVFPLTHERPCKLTPHQLYEGERHLFHGPLFEALDSTDRQGDEGIEGYLRTLPHSGLFRSTPQPDLLLDPLLIDASTHLLGCWHLSQSDRVGRTVLPYELGSVTLYGPRPKVGTRIKCRVRIEAISARQVSHRIDLLGPDDRLWCRLSPAEYWRFYWPLEYVDFFRHKERFLLAKDWPLEANPEVRCMRLDPPSDLCQPVHRSALARVTLSRSEGSVFRLLKGTEQELTDWLFARIAAKDAIRALWLDRHGQRLFPADIELDVRDDGTATAQYRGGVLVEELPRVTLAAVPGTCAAAAVFGRDIRLTLVRRNGEAIATVSMQ